MIPLRQWLTSGEFLPIAAINADGCGLTEFFGLAIRLAAKLVAMDSVDTFACIDKKTKEQLAMLMPLVKFMPRQTIVKEGDTADGFFFIMRGAVQVAFTPSPSPSFKYGVVFCV